MSFAFFWYLLVFLVKIARDVACLHSVSVSWMLLLGNMSMRGADAHFFWVILFFFANKARAIPFLSINSINGVPG